MYKPTRRSIRLQDYNYSQNGVYFVTICAQNRACLFGQIIDEKMKLNNAGEMIHEEWSQLSERFNFIQLDHYVIMPNHFHGIFFIKTRENCVTKNSNIGVIIGAFKSITTHKYINGVKKNHWPVFNGKLWQRNYYEQVLRDEESLYRAREYIINNPINWKSDKMNPLYYCDVESM